MAIRPLGDRVLIKRIEIAEETTKGGIIIPDTAKEKPMEGVIVAVGKGEIDENGNRKPMDVKVKDKVFISKYAGTEIKLDGVEHIIMNASDILAVIE